MCTWGTPPFTQEAWPSSSIPAQDECLHNSMSFFTTIFQQYLLWKLGRSLPTGSTSSPTPPSVPQKKTSIWPKNGKTLSLAMPPPSVQMPKSGGRITDPFEIVPDQLISPQHNEAPRQPPEAQASPATLPASEGGNKRSSASNPSLGDAAASPPSKVRRSNARDVTSTKLQEEFDQPEPADAAPNMHLHMPQRINLHEAGLRRSRTLVFGANSSKQSI